MRDIDPALSIFSSNQGFSNLVLDRGRARPREDELVLAKMSSSSIEDELVLARTSSSSKTNQPTHKKTGTGEILLDEISVS